MVEKFLKIHPLFLTQRSSLGQQMQLAFRPNGDFEIPTIWQAIR